MALAKTHRSAIEAELDREMQAELNASEQPIDPRITESVGPSTEQSKPQLKSESDVDVGLPEQQSLRFERSRKLVGTIWHALLGIAITIEQRVGIWFSRLVEKGENFRHQSQQTKIETTAKSQAEIVSGEETSGQTVKLTAVDKIHNFEHSIEQSLDRGRNNTLHWIGVPSREDYAEIKNQLQELKEKVKELERN